MELTRDEKDALEGKLGPMHAEMMRILVAIGELNDASKLIPVWSVQLSGISFKTMGVPGTEFLEDAAKELKFSVPTTINPAGYDVGGPGLVKVDTDFRGKQERIIHSLMSMGAIPTFSCTPYTTEYTPPPGAHLAWAESSAVIYANSVIGAFSNREGAPSALASAVVGKTPDYGLHRKEGRRAEVLVDVDAGDRPVHFTSLGAHLGKVLKSKIPLIRGVKPDTDEMKEMGAALSAWGSVPMFHVEGITHEAEGQYSKELESIHVDQDMVRSFEAPFEGGEEPDLIAIGCPHATSGELKHLAKLIRERRGGKLKPGKSVWICTNRKVIADNPSTVEYLQRSGVKVIQDTCMVVAPIGKEFPVIAVNSAKAAFYASKRSFGNQKVIFGTTDELIERWV